MKKFDYESINERLSERLSNKLNLPEEYKFLDEIDFEMLGFFSTEREYVDEYIVSMSKCTLIKK